MGEDTGGGKSNRVQAPQKSSAPIQTGTRSNGFVKSAKDKKGMTAADFKFKNDSPPPKAGTSVVAQKYPLLHRNSPCGCLSGKKYKKCCLL